MKRNSLWKIVGAIAFLGVCNAVWSAEIFVPSSGMTNGAITACCIQDAIDLAEDGDTVWVDAGTYFENINFKGKNITVASRFLESGDPADIAATIIDGGNTGRVVTFNANENESALLCGFTLQNGVALGTDYTNMHGGGIFCNYASPCLKDLVVKGNYADGEGGGIYLGHSVSKVENVVCRDNATDRSGAGIRVTYGCPSFYNVSVLENRSGYDAGGFQLYHADCSIRNALVAGNTAPVAGGGMFFDGASPILENVTIVNNSAPSGGGLNVSYYSHPKLINSIVWGNTKEQVAFNTRWYGMNLTVDHSDVQDGKEGVVTDNKGTVYWLAGNITVNPLLENDYTLQDGSPCINAGVNKDWMIGAVDLAGEARIQNDLVNMGAYETPGTGSGGTGVAVRVTTPSTPDGAIEGNVGEVLQYTTGGSVCSNSLYIEYRFDWGDGVLSDWLSVGGSSHSWDVTGRFGIRAQARAFTGTNEVLLSDWSESTMVDISEAPALPVTYYVSTSGSNVPPYESWLTASCSIQDAIDLCRDGDTVLVDIGTYVENINFKGKNITVASRFFENREQDCIKNTIIDGGGLGHVVTFDNGEDSSALFCGFTLTNGCAEGTVYTNMHGGGILCNYASPRLENLIVTGNRASGEGGGIYLGHSTSVVKNVVSCGNASTNSGGGIRITYGCPVFDNITVANNRSGYGGGGMQFYHADSRVRNALITGNYAPVEGGGMFFDASSPVLENLTVADNEAEMGGGLNVSYYSHPKLINSIVWGNAGGQVYFNQKWWGMGISIRYSDVEGGEQAIQTLDKGFVNWEEGNVDAAPLWGRGYTLRAGSPCVNVGSNAAWMPSGVDLAGAPRIFAETVDMGAYEWNGAVTGSFGWVKGIITPAFADGAGAAWRLTSGPVTNWNKNGDVIRDIPVGDYTVCFKELPGWGTPSSQVVSVTADTFTHVTGHYAFNTPDLNPPEILDVQPPDGYVGLSSHIDMTIVVTDDVRVVYVEVDRKAADKVGENVYSYTTIGVRGSHNPQVIIATDSGGNQTTQTVVYGKANKMGLTAMWDGCWRVTNPYGTNVAYTWSVHNSDESGSGIATANRYSYFETTTGSKLVKLYVNGKKVDAKHSSKQPPPLSQDAMMCLDSDGDGMSNLDEEIAGTDVNDITSQFCMNIGRTNTAHDVEQENVLQNQVLRSEAGPQFVFSWESSVDTLYTLEASVDLINWTVIPGYESVSGTGEQMSYVPDFTGDLLFVRIRAGKMP